MRARHLRLPLLLASIFGGAWLLQCSDPAPSTADAGVDASADVSADVAVDAGVDAPPACDDKNPCEAGTCCSGACTELTKDPRNCGACGAACTNAQFCNGKGCIAAIVKNLCENPKVAVALDGIAQDESAGAAIGDALDGGCSPTVAVRSVLQQAPGVLDDAGRPLLGVGETYLAAGGSFGQKAVRWVESNKAGPVYTLADSTSFSFVRTSDNGLLAKVQNVDLTAKHDYFVAYLAPDAQIGTLVVAIYGVLAPGSAAATWFATNQLIPNRASFAKQYYVYEWTDSDDAGTPNAPDANDGFKLLASGP